jgi:hypothetical protein
MEVEITYLGVELTVEGTYEPEEPSKTYGPPESCYEGSPSYFDIEDIFVGGVSIYEMFQCFAICTNKSPIGHADALLDLSGKVCEVCDNMEPDYDEAE